MASEHPIATAASGTLGERVAALRERYGLAAASAEPPWLRPLLPTAPADFAAFYRGVVPGPLPGRDERLLAEPTTLDRLHPDFELSRQDSILVLAERGDASVIGYIANIRPWRLAVVHPRSVVPHDLPDLDWLGYLEAPDPDDDHDSAPVALGHMWHRMRLLLIAFSVIGVLVCLAVFAALAQRLGGD